MTSTRTLRTALLVTGLVAVVVLGLAACAPGANDSTGVGGPDVAGFWLGLWQGLISPITFLLSLFNPDVNIYEVHNNGGWYNFGFMLGVSAVFSGAGGGGAARSRSSRRRRPV